MNRSFFAALVVVGFLVVPTATAAGPGENLLRNQSFELKGEENVGKAPPEWIGGTHSKEGVSNSPSSRSSATVARGGRTGRYGAILVVAEDDQWVMLDQRVERELAEGDTFVFSAWMKADEPVEVTTYISAYVPSLRKVYELHTQHQIVDEWRLCSTRITVSPGPGDPTRVSADTATSRPYLRVLAQVRVPGVKVYVDDAQLVCLVPGAITAVSESAKPVPEEETLPAPDQGGPNLLGNASFEEDGARALGKLPPGWIQGTHSKEGVSNSPSSRSSATVARGGRTGDYCAVLLVAEDDQWVIFDQRVERALAEGETFVFSAWMKADKPVEVTTYLSGYVPAMRKVYDLHTQHQVTNEWRLCSTRITIAPGLGDPTRVSADTATSHPYLRVLAQLRVPGVKVYVDDAMLAPVAPGAGPVQESPGGGPGEASAVAESAAPPGAPEEASTTEPETHVVLELPTMWLFRKDPGAVGEKERWFSPGPKGEPWKPLTTSTFWPEFIGDGWYAVDAVIPPAEGEKVWLVFGAVDENYTLWVNGERIGDNLGVPGELVWDKSVAEEITGRYKPSESNTIVVRVTNKAGGGGIWKPVTIVRGAEGKPPEAKTETPRHAKWLEPTDEYVTPHIAWEKPCAQGRMKVLFITYRLGMREIVEICERFDIEREVFAIELPNRFSEPADTTQYDTFPGTRPKDQEKRLREKLAGRYDCIVIGNIAWLALPDWARGEILARVAGGCGLVGYVKDGNDALLAEAKAEKREGDGRDLIGAFPFQGLPAFAKYGRPDEFARSTLALAQLGKGRIALFGGYACPTYQMLAPGITTPFTEWHMVHYDYYLALAGRAMRWASGREPDVVVLGPNELAVTADRARSESVTFTLDAKAPGEVDVEFALRHAETGELFAQTQRRELLKAGESAVSFELPPAPAGAYFADLWVRTLEGIVDFGSVLVEVTSESRIKDFALEGKGFKDGDVIRNYSQAEAITGRVTVEGAREGLIVEVTQRDNYGRLLARVKYPAREGAIEFALRPLAALSVLQHVEARLLEGDTALDARRTTFTYNDRFLPEPGEDVFFVMWEGLQGETYLNEYVYQVIRDAGFDIVWTQFNFDENLRSAGAALRANLYDFPSLHYPSPVRPRIWGDPIPVEEGSARFIRKPCLTDPATQSIVADTYRKAAETARKYSVSDYHLGSETELTSREPAREVCFSPTCIDHFREYLKKECGAIDALNAEYGASHADWSDVAPVDFLTAVRSGQMPLWIDFRRNMESVWAEHFARARDTITQIVPNAKVGTEGSDDPGHMPALGGLGGDDYYKLDKAQSLNIPYFYPPQLDALRDFAPPGTLTGTTYGGYTGVFRAERKGEWHRWLVWHSLLRYRCNSFHVWQGSSMSGGEIVGTTIAPDFSWYDFMGESIRTIHEIGSGVGKLLLALDRPDDGVAVLYSPASMLLANLSRDLPQRWDSFAAVSMIFPESNFQYRYIYPTELEGGILTKGGSRALYLPYCQALSPKEVEQIRAFVSEGGVVLADLRPGVADGHGKPYERGALDDVFGVRQETGKASASVDVVRLLRPVGEFQGELPFATTDRSVALAGGTALASVGESPAVIVNDFGGGKAILLNFAISDWVLDKLMSAGHTTIRFADEESALKTAALIQGLLAEAKVRPAVALAPSVPGCHLYRFEKEGVQLLGLLREIPPFLPGVGALPMKELDGISATWSNDVTLELDAERHVYDVLAGRYLGGMREVTLTVKPGVPHLLAALPYKVESVRIAPGKDTFKQGEELSFSVAVETDGGEAGLHVLRLEFTDPDGNAAKMYTQNARADGGRFTGRIPLSLDEKAGEWTITARDVATGIAGRTPFRVAEAD